MKTLSQLREIFSELFPGSPSVFIAPGRINLIGEHTDYNEGFVMPAAIDKHITFLLAPNRTDTFNFFAADYNESASFRLVDVKPGDGWVHYLMGVVHGFRQIGIPISGVDCVFSSTIPIGAGLSSSAALCCGFGFALSESYDLQLSRLALVKIAQYSEHQFAGVMCGIMDQYASLNGVKNSALLLDCKTVSHEILPADFGDHALLLIDSKVKHSLASTAYNDRRASCEEGVRVISKKYPNVSSLRDVNAVMLAEHEDILGPEVASRCRYVVEEIARTQHAATLLRKRDITAFGSLLNETHWGLSKIYEVSCPELDSLVLMAEDLKEMILGSRMMGGGFGGCTINLVRKDKVDYVRGYVHEKYFASFRKEPDFYLVNLTDGVHKA